MEVGSWKLEVGSWKLEVGSWKLEVGSWKLEVGSWKLEVGSWKIHLRYENMIQSFKDLMVYKESYELAMDVFLHTRRFPKEEIYSLTSQLIRASRSVPANISEGWCKRNYENIFKQHLIHALGSNGEVETWLNFSKDCSYIDKENFEKLIDRNAIIGRKITKLHQNWKSYEK
ncbi:four helix bundle protein [Zunongwangia sp. F363]|uniref:Four helix bundle protein n=1 Tax=Autumnicola tepida TaxID=3075595 RepID=A0ABU3CBK9_9FLAO|nr:four helix bundle protein [Zunongwangia sp. F363]MDT0643648.1 four helix bundle protein [Zunongwangia sp. F363]